MSKKLTLGDIEVKKNAIHRSRYLINIKGKYC